MAEATDKKAADDKPVTTYSVERLVAESSAFCNVPSHVMAGALASAKKKNLTLDEAKAAVTAFANHKVEIDNPVGSNNLEGGA